MKVNQPTPTRFETRDSTYVGLIIGIIFCSLMFYFSYFAELDWTLEELRPMRWVAWVALVLFIWTASSVTLVLDAGNQTVRWRRSLVALPFLPFVNRVITAPFDTIDEVELLRSRSGHKDVASLILKLTDGRALRISHASMGLGPAEDLQARMTKWIAAQR